MLRFLKRIMCFGLIFTVIFAMFINVGAEESNFTESKAKALVQKGFDIYAALNYGVYIKTTVDITSYDPLVYKNLNIDEDSAIDFGFSGNEITVHTALNGTKYPMDIGLQYYEIDPTKTGEFFGRKITNLDDAYAWLGNTFSGALLSKMKFDHVEHDFEKFRVGENGNVYMAGVSSIIIPIPLLLGCEDLNVSGDSATMNVWLGYNRGESNHINEMVLKLFAYKKTVEFEKTNSGWRISGGTFFDEIMDRIGNAERNPNTSDPTVPAVAILGTVVVISLALPVVIYRRRRRAA